MEYTEVTVTWACPKTLATTAHATKAVATRIGSTQRQENFINEFYTRHTLFASMSALVYGHPTLGYRRPCFLAMAATDGMTVRQFKSDLLSANISDLEAIGQRP